MFFFKVQDFRRRLDDQVGVFSVLLSVVVLMRARMAFFSASCIVPFFTPRSRLFSMAAMPFLMNSSLISDMVTL